MNTIRFRAAAYAVAASLALLTVSAAATAAALSDEEQLVSSVKQGPYAKIGPLLGNLSEEFNRSSRKKDFKSANPALKVNGGRVGVDLYASDAVSLRRALLSLGATKIGGRGAVISAQIPVSSLAQLAALPSLSFARPTLAAVRVASQGSVVSQGDVSLGSNLVRQTTGLDGTGITVGVLSDSYQCNPPAFIAGAPTSTAAQDVATQDVPPNVEVLENGECPGSDEGRAMVQLVHDVAPGAHQAFHSAFNSLVDFADGILELQEAGSDVIVDDVIYFSENMFSDGIVAQAADEAVRRGAAYFSSAGNQARKSYESAYREVSVPTTGGGNLNGKGTPFTLRAHDFDAGGGVDTLQKIHVTPAGGQAVIVFSFQWDQPFLSSTTYAHELSPTGTSQPRGATGDLDMLIYDVLADTAFDDDDGDGCNTSRNTFITPCLDNPADELPNFFGTSASAPHVAGVAALMLQKNGALPPAQVYSILSSTAEDITKREVNVVPGPGNSEFSPLPAGYDYDSGHGFVDAVAAIAATPGGT